jgi:coenzyme PQQ precursor peptide PqqA
MTIHVVTRAVENCALAPVPAGSYNGASPPVGVRRLKVSSLREELPMEWTKPEFTVVAVTMEVTAYAATK